MNQSLNDVRIFNVPKDGSNSVGFAPRSSGGSSSHVGAIVGGVIGGVAFVVFVAFAVFFFVYRHRNRAHRVTAALYDRPQEIEKPEEGGVHPYMLASPTNVVQFNHGPESTAGSSSFSPIGSSFSPIASTAAVASNTVPGLGTHEGDQALEIAPPSYEEASEGRPSPSSPGFRIEKGSHRAEQMSQASEHVQNPLPLPLHPIDENQPTGPSTSGSDTIWE